MRNLDAYEKKKLYAHPTALSLPTLMTNVIYEPLKI